MRILVPVVTWFLVLAAGGRAVHAQAPAPPPPIPEGRIWIPLPTEPGINRIQFETRVGTQVVRFPFLLYLPKGYNPAGEPLPAMLFLHGAAERGNDLKGPAVHGPIAQLQRDPKFIDSLRYIVIAPHCPADTSWENPVMAKAVVELVEEVGKTHRVDRERIVATGVNIGGVGACSAAMESPDRFAGVIAFSASAFSADNAVDRLKYPRLWLVVGGKDQQSVDGSRRFGDLLRTYRPDVQFQNDANDGPEIFARFYAEPKFYETVGNWRRLNPQQQKDRDAYVAAVTKAIKEPGHHKLWFETRVGEQPARLPYLLYVPTGYDPAREPRPLLIFLHGAGEAAEDLSGMFAIGPAKLIQADEKFRQGYPFIGLYPRLATVDAASVKLLSALIDEVCRNWRVDADRVILTGLGQGGTAAWMLAMETPERFAAIAPVCGGGASPQQAGAKLRNMPAWIISGSADGPATEGSRQMANALIGADAVDLRVRVVPGPGKPVAEATYSDPQFYQWLAAQKRRKP